MKDTKLVIIVILVVLALLLILLNTGIVKVNLLFIQPEMPMILLLLIATGLGFLIGLLVARSGKKRLKK